MVAYFLVYFNVISIFILCKALGYVGCFIDDEYRVLEPDMTISDNQSVELCVKYCFDGNFKYAGLEHEDECFCGNNDTYDRLGQAPDSECHMKCSGNSNQFCGGDWRISIYKGKIASNPNKQVT